MRTNFANADLAGARFNHCNLSGANLGRANLDPTEMKDEKGNGTGRYFSSSLVGSNLNDANLTDARLRDADLTNASLLGATLKRVNFDNATLEGTGNTFDQVGDVRNGR